MTVYTEGRHPGEFLLSEAAGQRSREAITIASGAGVVAPGTVLGKVAASGKYVPRDATADDGSEAAAAICLYGCDATSADQDVSALVRDGEVKGDALTFVIASDEAAEKASAISELGAAGLIVR